LKFIKKPRVNIVIDVGNTRVKAAVFEEDKLVSVFVFDKKRILTEVRKILKNFTIHDGILSSVASISDFKLQKLHQILPFTIVSAKTKVPFQNIYSTPNTLGVDRIALVVAAQKEFPKKNVLVIDAGTCLTFDFIRSNSDYLGGAISPGIQMRYESLHKFTSKLPFLSAEVPTDFIGNSTTQSMHSGVVNGVLNEIDGLISLYKKKYTDLTVVLTGGDTNFLSKQLKSSIFANQNFLLFGLNEILIFNKSK
jgi:type III pantothenate kinase